jgi:hypothetical protein
MGAGLPVAFEICRLERLNNKKFLRMSSSLERLPKSGFQIILTCYLVNCFNQGLAEQ